MKEEELIARARESETPICHHCGLPQSRNPHPDAGKPSALLQVGTPYVCIPCLTANRHAWAERAMKAESEISEAAAALPVLEALGKFLEQVAREQKPLLTRLEARPKGGEPVPVISLWAAYGEGNPVERVDELNRQLEESAAALRREREARERAEAQANALRDFAQKIMGDEPGDVDGFTIQEAALECGLLKRVEVAAPCCEHFCACAEVGAFPVMCNQRAALLTGE